MIIPIELRFKADKDSKSAFRTDKTIKSHDVNSVEFHISIDGLELTDNHTAKILSVFHSSKSQANMDCEIVEGKIIYKPDTNLISRHEHVTNYVYVYKDNQSLDVREFIYVVDLSKIDETSLEVKEVYDQSYAGLLADFEQALNDYKDSLPQADSVRADIDEILTQFSEDSQAMLSLINGAESSRVQAEGQRDSAESIRVQSESQRVSAESNRVNAEAQRVLAENERSDKYENYAQQFNDVITELSKDKDYHSLPEIAGARGGFDTLGRRLDDTTAQLAQKANEDEVRKRNVPISLNDVDPDLLGAIQGGDATSFNLLSIPRKHSVSPSTTTFVSVGKNLFNKNSAIRGYNLDYSGNMIANNDYYVSEYMIVNANETYTRRFGEYRTVFYDSSFNMISAINAQNTFTTPETCAYVRIAIYYTRNEIEQFEKGDTQSDYEPYKIDIKELTVHDDVAKVSDDVSQVGQEVKVVNENLRHLEDYKEYEILDKTGSFVSDRPQISTFSGWAYPFNKDDILGTLKGIKMYVGVGDETDVPAKFIILSDTHEELFSFTTTIPETGYVKKELAEPIEKSVLPQTFYVGIVTTNEPNTVLVPPFSERNPNYNDRGLSPVYTTGSSWREATGGYVGVVELLGDYTYSFNTESETNKVKLSLPLKYDLVVGDTFELFYKGIILASDPYKYDIKITGSKGRQFKRKFDFTPSEADVGTHPMTIAIRDDNGTTLSSKRVDLVVRNKKTSLPSEKNVLCVGDSLLSSGLWAKELHNRLVNIDGLNLNFIGTKTTGDVGYEGYGGWTYDRYLSNVVDSGMVWVNGTHDKTQDDQWSIYKDSNNTEWKLETIEDGKIKLIRTSGSTAVPNSGTLNWVSGGVNQSAITYTSTTAESGNPFWNEATNQVDFANYASEQGVSSIDYVYILLGWNNTNSSEKAYKNSQRSFINKIKDAYPNAKIVLLGLQVPSLDGFGSNYGVSWNFIDKTKFVFEMDRWNKEVASEYTGITSINIAGQFDTEYNMPSGSRPVNNRNTTTEKYGTNGVHPDTSGYLQIADAAYRHSHAIL